MIPGSVSFRFISKNWHHDKVGEELSISYARKYIGPSFYSKQYKDIRWMYNVHPSDILLTKAKYAHESIQNVEINHLKI